MDEPLHLPSVFRFYGNAVAVAAHGYDRILQIGPERTVYQGGQGRVYFVIDAPDAAADMLQCTAGVIADLILGDDASLDL